MSPHLSPPAAGHLRRAAVVVIVLSALAVALVLVLGPVRSRGESSPTDASWDGGSARPSALHRSARSAHGHEDPGDGAPGGLPGLTGGVLGHTLGLASGEVPDGTTVFADVPALTRLDPALLEALRAAGTAAAADGIELDVNSGWRSGGYQARLFADAVATYGSQTAAEQWVARPGTSVHEAGDAADIGPAAAAAWLARNGAGYGLCQTYLNEPWHYELRPAARDSGCPTPYSDPTHDPRLR